MNKKGFASSVIIYTIFAIFLVAISIMLFTINNSVSLNKALNENTLNDLKYGDTNSGLEDRITALESKLSELEDKNTKLESELSNSNKKTTELENKLTGFKGSVINEVYPVGSIYISTEDDTVEKVESKFGGEWEAYSKGTTLVGSGTYTDSSGNVETYTVNGKQEGSNLVKLTTSNLPSHSHSISHTHTYSGTTESTGSGYTIGTTHTSRTSGSTGSGYTIGTTHASRTSGSTGSGYSITYGYSGRTTNATDIGTYIKSTGSQFSIYTPGGAFVGAGWSGTSHSHTYNDYYVSKITGVEAHTHSYNDYYANKITGVEAHTHSYNDYYANKITGVEAHTHEYSGTTDQASTTTSGLTGSGKAFNAHDPYVTVYMYRRVK